MLVLTAPNFQPSGEYLTADYVLDFTKDLNISIPCEGTWQGDRKKALSLYVDNYNNAYSLNIYNGGGSVKVPAYTAANINVSKTNDVVITSDGLANISAYLSTEPKATSSAASRGNTPSAAGSVLSYLGSIPIGSSNGPFSAVYNAYSGYLIVCSSAGNVIIIDPKTRTVVKVLSATYQSLLVNGPSGGKYVYVLGGNSLRLINMDSLTMTTLASITATSPAGGCYDTTNNRFFFIAGGGSSNKLYFLNCKTDGTLVSTGVGQVGMPTTRYPSNVTYCQDGGFIYVSLTCLNDTATGGDIMEVNAGPLTVNAYYSVDVQITGRGGNSIDYIPELKRVFVGGTATSNNYLWSMDVITKELKNFGNCGSLPTSTAYCPESKNIYVNTGDVADLVLQSIISTMPNYPTNPASLCNIVYCGSSAGVIAFPRADKIINFGR